MPKKLQAFAGVTQWVERLAGATYREACERANLFGVRTDAEIKKLSAALKSSSPNAIRVPNEPGCTFTLADAEIDQIAIAYFAELEKRIQKAGGYRRGVTDVNRNDVLIDLAQDYERADAVATGNDQSALVGLDEDISAAFHRIAFKQLIQYGFLDGQSSANDRLSSCNKQSTAKVGHIPNEVRASRSFQRLADKLAEANAEIARRRLEANAENRHPTLGNPVFEPALSSNNVELVPQKQVRIGELIDSYLATRQQEVGRSRYDQLLLATRALDEELGRSLPLLHVTRQQCQMIADLFIEVPAWVSRHYKGLTLRKAAAAYQKKQGRKVERHSEAKKHLSVLREIFEFAIDKEWIEHNPAKRVKISAPVRPKSFSEQEEGYEAFTNTELERIFSQPLYTGCQNDQHGINRPGPNRPRRSRFWLPLISLFSGMRMQEILQLERSDICEADGVFYFSVNDKIYGDDYLDGEYVKKLKTRNSLRNVPIHPELIRLGFLDFVAASRREWLFSDMPCGDASKMSDQFSKRFRTFLKPTGIWVPRRKVFHSFRNTFNDALRKAEVGRELREPIMGWVDYKKMDNRYGSGHLIDHLSEQVARVRYDGLDLSALHIKE